MKNKLYGCRKALLCILFRQKRNIDFPNLLPKAQEIFLHQDHQQPEHNCFLSQEKCNMPLKNLRGKKQCIRLFLFCNNSAQQNCQIQLEGSAFSRHSLIFQLPHQDLYFFRRKLQLQDSPNNERQTTVFFAPQNQTFPRAQELCGLYLLCEAAFALFLQQAHFSFHAFHCQ